MITYEDLLTNTNNDYLDKRTKVLQIKLKEPLNLNNADDKWLAVTYLYAIQKKLLEYQARSFASELTLFLTGKVYDTDVYFVYREYELDSHLYKKFEEIHKKYPNNSKEFYFEFIDYLLKFYSTSLSWKYERVSKYLQFRLSEEEKQMFYDIPISKPKQKFIYLLKSFDYNCNGVEYERNEELSTYFAINLTPSEHQKFLSVAGDTKTDKFLNLLYYYYQNKRCDDGYSDDSYSFLL